MSAFGAPFGQSSAFGATSAFGANPAPFGSTNTPFGGQSTTAPLFGASQNQQPQSSAFGTFGQSSAFGGGSAPVFGASSSSFGSSAPAFGSVSSSPAFGTSAPAFANSAFGSQQSTAFGAPSTPFGAASSSAFGSTSLFGNSSGSSLFGNNQATATPFGGSSSVFGQSQPAWGSAPSPGFGASSTPFGAASSASLFGAASSSSLFGSTQNGAGAFGAASQQQQPQQQQGTAGANWQVTVEYDSNPGTQCKYHAISMMQQFRDKSLEELRLEDYSIGNKDGSVNPSPTANPSTSLFGATAQTAPSTGLFGGASASTFGQTPAFGAAQNNTPFGAPSTTGALFGGGGSGGSNLFGASSGPAQSSGGLFGSSGSAFGANQPQTSGGLFGSAQSSHFGANAASGGAFGSTGSSFGVQFSSSLFSQPNAFGVQSQPQGFGAVGSSGGTFGAAASNSGASVFGQTATGAQTGGNLFGTQPNPSPFGNSAQQQPLQTPLFGQQAPANPPTGGLFAQTLSALGPAAPFSAAAQPQQGSGLSSGLFSSNTGQPTANPLGGPLAAAPISAAQPSVPGIGSNPTLIESYNAVVQHNGSNIAPPGANYGTVLHNLQKLQDDFAKHNRLMEEQSNKQPASKQSTDSLSVVVLPSPPMLTFGSNQLTLGATGPPNRTGTNSTRLVGHGVTGTTAIASSRAVITPSRTPMRNVSTRVRFIESNRVSASGSQKGPSAEGDSTTRAVEGDATPFFTPRQFSGAKRRPLRGSEVSTPVRTGPLVTPRLKDRQNSSHNRESDDGIANGRGSKHGERPPPHLSSERERENTSGLENRVSDLGQINGGNDRNERSGQAADPGNDVKDLQPTDERQMRQGHTSSAATPDKDTPNSMRNYLWSAKRPSQWSVRLGLRSQDQYDPAKYLPVDSRPDYYLNPRVSELSVMDVTELQHVKGFTVGREGYGYIEWLDPVDVRGLVLDDCVEIKRGEVAVMPDREASQLDAPARVTLEGMFPKNKKKKVDVDVTESRSRFEKSLRRFCEQLNLKFVSYDGESGVWVFQADGFKD